MTHPIPENAYVMIIGAMKCGTSSLYSYLKKHPEICPASTKEPEFFSENQKHGVAIENYSDLWNFDHTVHKYALEASTGYTKYPTEPNVAQNIFNYGIKPKFIYIIRNPFERIASHFNYMRRDESWLANIDSPFVIHTSNYFLQLEQYTQYFPLEDILVLDFDDLKKQPQQVLQTTYAFLQLSSSYFPPAYEVKNSTPVESKIEWSLRRLKLRPWLKQLPEPIKQAGKRLLQRTPPVERRVLTETEKAFIYRELQASMVRLQQVYGFDVGKWGFDAA
ncbi:sulfotransferase domain-containing protein [Almyronema epifaneia]|uniref:Sulfotransferase domain-containing protein n=1 Tax=Almyronema epifaneia S1 TaxID=2991925 RepID=A0ABW6IM62_9CYAN